MEHIDTFKTGCGWDTQRGSQVPQLEECGYYSYEKEKEFCDYIIGIDEYGDNIMHSCNPDKLADNFGRNPDAQHYLTPVYFKKDVLQKYYSQPDIYSVEDSALVYDNAVAENFFSCLKCELIHHKHYFTRSQAQADIFAYIEGLSISFL